MFALDRDHDADGPLLRLGGELTIYHAGELRRALLDDSAAHAGVRTLDLSGVEEFDWAGLQVLLMARRAAERAGGRLCLRNHSEAVREVIDRYGLAAHFGDPVLIPAARADARGETR